MERKIRSRYWGRFRLRSLLILAALSSVVFAWVAWNLDHGRKEQDAISWIEQNGGKVIFHSFFKPDKRNWWERNTDRWFGGQTYSAELRNASEIDLSPLKELKDLRCLALSNTQVSDLTPLSELKNLEELYLEGTQVRDLSPLGELSALEMLWLDGTPVSDLTPLCNLKNLKWLKLRNTHLSEQQVQDLQRELPDCDIIYSQRK